QVGNLPLGTAYAAPGADVVLAGRLLCSLYPRRLGRVPPGCLRQGLAVQARVEAEVAEPLGELLPGALGGRGRRLAHRTRAGNPRAARPAPRQPRMPSDTGK